MHYRLRYEFDYRWECLYSSDGSEAVGSVTTERKAVTLRRQYRTPEAAAAALAVIRRRYAGACEWSVVQVEDAKPCG